MYIYYSVAIAVGSSITAVATSQEDNDLAKRQRTIITGRVRNQTTNVCSVTEAQDQTLRGNTANSGRGVASVFCDAHNPTAT